MNKTDPSMEGYGDLRDGLWELIPALRFAYLFGSRASGRARPDSDLDLAIDAGRPLGVTERARLAVGLEPLVGVPVDVVDLWTAGPILRMQVLAKGLPLLAPDAPALKQFCMRTPSAYADWKLSIRPIESATRRRLRAL